MNQPPLISVIIPVYNGEKYLAQAIESVLGQNYSPIEIIVVDDGSTDGSWQILQQYRSLIRIRKENGGVASARNLGIKEARGDLCAFLDQDDFWTKDKLSKQVAMLQADPALGFVLCHCRHFIDPHHPPPVAIRREVTSVDQKTYIPGAWLIRKKLLEQVGGFDEKFRVADDTDLMFKLADLQVPYSCSEELLLFRRLHNNNASHQNKGGYSAKELLSIIRMSLQRK